MPRTSADLFELDLREQRRGFASHEWGRDVEVAASGWLKGGVVADLVPGGDVLEVERSVERRSRAREERLDQDGDDTDRLGQVDQDGLAGVWVGPGQLERHGGVDVAVGGTDDLEPDPLEGDVVLERADGGPQVAYQGGEVEPGEPPRGRLSVTEGPLSRPSKYLTHIVIVRL